MIKFGPWLPDVPSHVNPGLVVARNVYPIAGGYGPFSGPAVISNALTGQCRGAIQVALTDGTIARFAGDDTKLYELTGSTYGDVSGSAFSVPAGDRWRFTLYGSRLIAANGSDNTQKFDIGVDSTFSALTGAPKARFFIAVRDTLVGLDVTDGTDPLEFSANNNSEKWTQDCGGGSQPFPDGGPIVGGVGGEYGTILQKHAITRMNFVGGDERFQFDKIEGARGCIAAGSIVEVSDRVFYLSAAGFDVFNGAESRSISDQSIVTTFFGRLDASNIHMMQAAYDPTNQSIIWVYPTSSAAAGTTDEMVIFNIPERRWTEAQVNLQTLLDDNGTLAGFDTSNRLVRFTGSALSGVIKTGEYQFGGDREARIRGFRIETDDAAHTINVETRDKISESVTASGAISPSSATGICRFRKRARYAALQVNTTGRVTGFDVAAMAGGRPI